MRFLLMLFVSAVCTTLQPGDATCAQTANSESPRHESRAVGVEDALPVVGRPCRLWLTHGDDLQQYQDLVLTFHVSRDGQKTAHLLPAPTTTAAIWTPQHTGIFRISALVSFTDDRGRSQQFQTPAVDVFVTSRQLHFNYWQCRPEQRFVTSVMDNSETAENALRWRRRGVRALDWHGGQWHWSRGYGSAEKMAKLWESITTDRVGFVIDEFGGGDAIDQQLGDALRLVREQLPEAFLAPYCLSVSGEKMIAGFRESDLILVETYTADWRWDGFITGRWKTAAAAGLGNKSIAVLGLGSQWIGTERELRRVVRMIRKTCPEMPGIGFFPDVPPRLMKAVDLAIEDYFLRPVVDLRVDADQFTVMNVGERPAADIRIIFLDTNAEQVGDEEVVAVLDPGMRFSGKLPTGAADAAVTAAPERFTLLDYQPPVEAATPGHEQQRAARAYRQHATRGRSSTPLQRADEMIVVRTEQDNQDERGQIRSADLPIRDTQGQPVALSFDLCPKRCWFYGHNRVSLIGEGELALTWSRQDHDAGLEGNQPRPTLIFQGKDDYVVRETSSIGFRENHTYHVLLSFDGCEKVRAIVSDDKDTVLWDSGFLPAQGGFRCDTLRFEVNPYERSEISLTSGKQEILLRGGGGKADSPYWLESTLSEFRLITAD